MAEYTIKLVDVAAEARERLGDLANVYFGNENPDWRFVISKGGVRFVLPIGATAEETYQWLDTKSIRPDEIHLADES